jgi:hypothetical protein
MPYSEPEIAILKKYRVMNPDGTLRQADLQQPLRPGDQAPGMGPIMAPDVINKLLKTDPTPDKRWLDWVFFEAGGGETAKAATVEALRQIRDRFIDERTNGWTHPATGVYQPPVPREQAEQRWTAAEPKFREVLTVCDQDQVKRLRTFGYFRDMPGNANRYTNVIDAMTKYMKLYTKLVQMNKEVAREGGEAMADAPDSVGTWEKMADIAKKVERYFASKKARTDIRIVDNKPIYEDDIIVAVVPLTYAAAVRYGYDLWPWASRKGFEGVLSGESGDWRFRDEWKQRTQRNIFVYLRLKGPVPAWVTRREGNWEVKDLTDLALELDKDNLRTNTDDWVVYDQENRNTLTIGQVKAMILAEPTRVDPTDEESPIIRGGNAYKDQAEAQRVVDSLERAIKAVKKRLLAGKINVKSDVFTLESVEAEVAEALAD